MEPGSDAAASARHVGPLWCPARAAASPAAGGPDTACQGAAGPGAWWAAAAVAEAHGDGDGDGDGETAKVIERKEELTGPSAEELKARKWMPPVNNRPPEWAPIGPTTMNQDHGHRRCLALADWGSKDGRAAEVVHVRHFHESSP